MTPAAAHRPAFAPAVAAASLVVAMTLSVMGSVVIVASTPAGAQEPGEERYRPPVDAPVIDPFRPPSVPWGPGNRGLEYGTGPGTPVRAIGPGVVSFAGPVAGTLHVTITHPDGLRSSYSGVAAVRRSVGEPVHGGDLVALSAATLHLGVRDGDRYIDPASLWGAVVESGPVVLVPVDEASPRPGTDDRRRQLARVVAMRALAWLGLGPWAR